MLGQRAVRRGRGRIAYLSRRRGSPITIDRPVAPKRRATPASRKSLLCGCYVQRRGKFRAVSYRGFSMATAAKSSRSGDNPRGNRSRLVERFGEWCAAKYGDDDSASIFADDDTATGPDQTSRFVRGGWERRVRYAVIVALLAVAGIGYATLCKGIDTARAKRAIVPDVMPAIERHSPPINSGKCLVINGIDGFVGLGRHHK